MDPIRETFARLARARRTALMPFIMGGDPSLRATGPLLLALQDAGADLIEVGIPFSDPLADGPVIQAAATRALARGATPQGVLRAVASVRRRLRVPVLALSYWNPMVQFSAAGAALSPLPFVRAAKAAGFAGVIVPDVPVEEGGELRRAARAAGLAAIFLAAPTSTAQRLRAVSRASEGFIYYVSVTGTTGVRQSLPAHLRHGVRQLKLLTTKPVCVGFGISTPAQARAVAGMAEGVIVGSAVIRAMQGAATARGQITRASAFVGRLRRAL